MDWNAEILSVVAAEDTSPNQIVTRTAQRVASKGFILADVKQQPGISEGFNWGRSSHGVTRKTLWTVTFTRDTGDDEYTVVVVLSTTTYERRNPYDRVPADHGKTSFGIQATDATKAVLGWYAGSGR